MGVSVLHDVKGNLKISSIESQSFLQSPEVLSLPVLPSFSAAHVVTRPNHKLIFIATSSL